MLHALREPLVEHPVLAGGQAVLDYLTLEMAHAPVERVRVLFLDGSNRLLRDEEVARGSVDRATIYPREVVRRALELGALGMVVVHNHPSGSLEPSRAGVSVTLARADAGEAGAPTDVVVTNPPWNLAVDGAGSLRTGLDALWRRLPDLLIPQGRVVAITDAGLDAPHALAQAGLGRGLVTRVRLAGRVSDVVLATTDGPALPDELHGWRERAIAAGVVTAAGF